jgi:hypothetical protein
MAEWKYLQSEAFQTRYAIAAWLVLDYDYIFEIGGYKTPISMFLDGDDHRQIWSIDPRMETEYRDLNNCPCEVHHVGKRWPDVEFPEVPHYALVVLGLELHLTEPEWQKFYELVRNSERTVLGVVPDHIHSLNQYNQIVEATGARKTMEVTLDLSQNDFGDLTDSAPPKTTRRIVVLECDGP